ncbi:MAG TPA: glycosyltransferase [Chloroflexia bacterium]|nr:glycosyltransferase [Chloroflexia bacterium]
MKREPLRILHVTPIYEPAYVYGGPARSLPMLCRSLVRAGAQVTVLTTNANGAADLDVPLGQSVDLGGVETLYYPRRSPRGVCYSPELAKACEARTAQFDLVHTTGMWTYPAVRAAAISRRRGKPYVVSPRGMLMKWEMSHKAWKKRLYFYAVEYGRLKKSAGIHCTTQAEKDGLSRFGLEGRGFVVANGLDTAEFEQLPARGRLRERLGISQNAQVLLFMGRLHPKKGIEDTLAAFKRLASQYPKLHLVLSGPDEGGYVAMVGQWVAQANLAGRVHLTGKLQDTERLAAFRDADAFVLLSHSENFGMGVAEAMACGLPVVVSEEVGISPWVARWNAGLTTRRDTEAAAQVLANLLDHPEEAHAMGERGKRLVASEFSADAVGRQMLAKYYELVESHRYSASRAGG